MSISIMTLSSEAKDMERSRDYHELTELTKDGLFVNIVDKSTCDNIAKKFFSSMSVYPSSARTSMREFFNMS